MANFFTRALDTVTPWNRGGEVQRRQEKKKRDEEQARRRVSTPTVSNTQPTQRTFDQPLRPNQPVNIFETLNKNLTLGQPNSTVSVFKTPDTQPVQVSQPGTVVSPDIRRQQLVDEAQKANSLVAKNTASNASNWSKLKNTAVGAVANIPEVGLAAARVGTGIVQGVTQIPHLATALTAFDTEQLNKVMPNRFTHALNTGAQAVNTGTKKATEVVNKPLDAVNRNLDSAAKTYERNVPMAAGGANVYKTTQIPLNVLAGLLTLGGSTAATAGNVGRVGRVSRFLDKPRTSNPSNIIAKTGQVVNKGAPVARAVMSPIKSTRAGVTKLINSRAVPIVDRVAVDAGEAGNVLTNSQLDELTKPPTSISVRQGIDVNQPPSVSVNVPVRNMNQPKPLIQEVGGDASVVTPNPLIQKLADDARAESLRSAAFDQAKTVSVPNSAIEGIISRPATQPYKLSPDIVKGTQSDVIDQYAALLRDVGEGNGVDVNRVTNTRVSNNYRPPGVGSKRMTKADWRAEAENQLRNGKAETGIQKAFDDASNPEVQSLLANGEQPTAPEGRPITVKEVKGIPVTDKTVIPQGLPETPGTVRATVQTSPMAAKSEAVANAPTPAAPAALPKEVQNVLDNPKQFTKRQVAAARNQRRLARQLAKTKADTQAVIDNSPQLAPKPDSGTPGFVPTGEFKRGVRGNVSETAHQSTESAQGASDVANLSSGDVLAQANKDIAETGTVGIDSERKLQAMIDSGRLSATSPEFIAISKTLNGGVSDVGRRLSLANRTLRRTATGDQLANRFISKLYGVSEDGVKLPDAHIATVTDAENQFAAARDAANQALDRYNATKSAADFNAWKQARQVADDAEKQSLITEYKVANDVLKGNKSPEALKAIQKAEQDAGVYQMDWIDANMLSGTGTATRNYINTSLVRLENRLFGGRGYSSRGAKLGNKVGNRSVVTDVKARSHFDQNVLSKTVKQWSTTANTLGEGNIKAVGSARAYKYYADQLKAKGVTGDQLKMDTETMLHTDPDGMAKHYEQWSLTENALSGMSRSGKIEQMLVDKIASKGHGKLAQNSAKALVRLTVGFPTVIGRSLVGGAKRATVGVPDLITAGKAFAKGDTQAMKDALYTAKVHAGSGAALYALGTALASAGIISPAYPSDPVERELWKTKGIQPNSINIAGNWFSIPGYFGALALPLTIPANVINKTSPEDIAKGVADGIQDLSPTAGIVNFINGMEGRGGKQWIKNEVASLTRAFTPAGSLLNQIAKMTDSEKNDTTTKDAIGNLVDAIAGGIPGVNNMVNKIPATDVNGNILHNPNPIATFFGAQGSEQPQGQQDVKNAQNTANDTYKQLKDYGILGDKSLMGLVDKKIQAQIGRGQDLTPEQVKKVQEAVVKGVTATGEDTVYLEKGQYDTNLAALKVKKDLMSSDPTTKPSDLAKMGVSIKRGQIYKDNTIPYDMISAYKSTSLTDWRAMGTPPEDKNYNPDMYDPEMYQKLWDIDQLMTKAGVSYKKDHLDKNKYSASKAGTGSGGSGTKQLDTSFGTLKAGTGAPTVQQYDTIDAKSGSIPHIAVKRPNIVHTIGRG